MGDRVKFTVKRTVVSTKPVETGKSYRLSALDHVMEPNHIRLVYYYQCPKDRELGEITKKLRESLAHTLTCFPIMTGRLVNDDNIGGEDESRWRVKCNDAGVRVLEATAKGTMEEWLRSVDREEELKLVYWEDMYHIPYYWSTFYVQLTEFEDGGFAIGLSCTHLLADPICVTMFIRAWADITLAQTMSAPPLFHSLPTRRSINMKSAQKRNKAHLVDHYSKSRLPIDTMNRIATVTFLFRDITRPDIAGSGSTVLPFTILAGLFWACVSKAKGVRDGLMDMSIGLDMRQVLNLDQGYFGNCMIYNKVQCNLSSPSITTEDQLLSHAIDEIRATTKEMDYNGVMELIEWLRNKHSVHLLSDGSDLVCINLENMVDPHLIMFEEEFIPSRVSCYIEGASGGGRQVIVLPPPPGEEPMSRTVAVTLPVKEMAKVMEDELLRRFSPLVLTGIKNVKY